MTTVSSSSATPRLGQAASAERVIRLIDRVGSAVLRYGLVFLLLLWGSLKFSAIEAEAIRPLVEHSPLLAWLYGIAGVRGASSLLGVFEILAALLIASRRWFPRLSGYGSLMASAMFLVTLSFLLTTPNVFAASSPWGGFLMKDLVLLGAALSTAAEALQVRRPQDPRGSPRTGECASGTESRGGCR